MKRHIRRWVPLLSATVEAANAHSKAERRPECIQLYTVVLIWTLPRELRGLPELTGRIIGAAKPEALENIRLPRYLSYQSGRLSHPETG